jgi:NitT/TauT family transport system substrate-binding protein
MLLANRADISAHTAAAVLPDIGAGKPFVVLAGIHGGCEVLFGNERVRAIRDLKGKRIGVPAMVDIEYYFIAAMVAYVGMDPRKDIQWVETHSYENLVPSFIDGRVDAIKVGPPLAQDLRARKIGHVLLDIGQDQPWNQYFCCIVTARKDFVAKTPIATKRALRAILKASDICAQEPESAARFLVAKGFEANYDVALEALKSLSYNRWRTYDVEDSLRFFGVRLHEGGLIKTNPPGLISRRISCSSASDKSKTTTWSGCLIWHFKSIGCSSTRKKP